VSAKKRKRSATPSSSAGPSVKKRKIVRRSSAQSQRTSRSSSEEDDAESSSDNSDRVWKDSEEDDSTESMSSQNPKQTDLRGRDKRQKNLHRRGGATKKNQNKKSLKQLNKKTSGKKKKAARRGVEPADDYTEKYISAGYSRSVSDQMKKIPPSAIASRHRALKKLKIGTFCQGLDWKNLQPASREEGQRGAYEVAVDFIHKNYVKNRFLEVRIIWSCIYCCLLCFLFHVLF
jgi:hypothetical protein